MLELPDMAAKYSVEDEESEEKMRPKRRRKSKPTILKKDDSTVRPSGIGKDHIIVGFSGKAKLRSEACIPIAGLVILHWPLVVLGSILSYIIWSIFVGLYGPVVIYQEKLFKHGITYIIAMVSEFDEYTNN